MTDDEYRDAMDILTNQVRVISMLPLEIMLETVERAESVGYLFVAPMDYTTGLDNLRDQKKILRAALGAKKAVEEITASATEKAPRRCANCGHLAIPLDGKTVCLCSAMEEFDEAR